MTIQDNVLKNQAESDFNIGSQPLFCARILRCLQE